jgi:hypothetical protein
LLDLLRRVAVLTIVSAVGIGLLAPLTARSALPEDAAGSRLLDAADAAASALDRGPDGRSSSAALALSQVFRPIGPESIGPAAEPATPANAAMEATLYQRPVVRPAAIVAAPPTGGSKVKGLATWYCCTLGYRGQAVVALPGALGGHFDPSPPSRYVTVCADRCVRLPVVDYCGCYWGTAEQKVADLSPEAWAAVTDLGLSRGVVHVTIHLDG